MIHWYEDEKKVIELAEFLVHSNEIISTEELLEYFKHPERYTGVWNIYEKEILGKISTFPEFSKKTYSHSPEHVPRHTTPLCACGQHAPKNIQKT